MSNTPEGHDQFTVVDNDNKNVRTFDSRSEAEDTHTDLSDLKPDADITIHYPGDSPEWMYHGDTEDDDTHEDRPSEPCAICGTEVAIADARSGPKGAPIHGDCRSRDDTATDGGDTGTVEVTPEPVDTNTEPVPDASTDEGALADLGESINDDPLDILPSYMITTVDGDPTLNKRGVSVLAFHFDVEVVDHEVVVYPHETDYETCVMRFTVVRDGKEYVGHGEAHVDEMEKTRLVRMAETRAYKRAVIFATGTGIVGYQEIMSEL